MIIKLRRHGPWNKETGELTPEGKEEAKRLSMNKKFKAVFSAKPDRCQESSQIISGKKPIVSTVFNDIKPKENIARRIQDMVLFISSSGVDESDEILVLTHNNLIAAIDYFYKDKPIPQDLSSLPLIPHFKGIKIDLSRQKP